MKRVIRYFFISLMFIVAVSCGANNNNENTKGSEVLEVEEVDEVLPQETQPQIKKVRQEVYETTCRFCKGRTIAICRTCLGAGWTGTSNIRYNCTECRGDQLSKCRHCIGRGKCVSNCWECNNLCCNCSGQGVMYCRNCKGLGYNRNGVYKRECSNCHGRTTEKCDVCWGKGYK